MSAKEEMTAEWMEALNAWNNSLYTSESVPSYRSNHTSNYIYSTIESIRPLLFDSNIKFEALPLTYEALPYSQEISEALDYEWHRTGMKEKLIANSIYTLVMGTSCIMLPYQFKETQTDGFDGDVEPILVSPFNIYPDPLATCIEDAEYIIYATYQHVNQLKKAYPDKAEFLEGGEITYDELVNSRNENAKIKNQVLVLEVWCRDYTTIDTEEEDGTTKTKMQYPLGRVITTAPDFGVVLEDKENPYETGRFPFFLFKNIDVPFQFWGEGEVKWLLSPQKAINDLTNQIIDNAKHTANQIWVTDKNSGIPKGQLTNRPGLVIRKNPGTVVERISPPSMPMYVSEMINSLKYDIEVVSGVHDVTRGENPSGIESGTAIIALQEAAQTRVRLKSTLHEQALAKLGTEWVSRMKQFWKSNRLIPVEKPASDNRANVVQNGAELTMQQPVSMIANTHTGEMIDTSNAHYDFVQISNDKQLAQSYKVKIVGSSGFNINRAAMFETMLKLLQTPAEDGLPVVTREALLNYLPDVNKDIIMKSIEKIKQEQLMKEQQQYLNNENIQQLQMLQQQTGELGSAVGGLQERANQEDDARKRDEIMSQGYQQGMNEALAMQDQQSKSGRIPDELMQQMAEMSDEELAALLQENPELVNMI